MGIAKRCLWHDVSARANELNKDSDALNVDKYNIALTLTRGERAVLSDLLSSVNDIGKLKTTIPSAADDLEKLKGLPEKMRVDLIKRYVESFAKPVIQTAVDKLKNTLFKWYDPFIEAIDRKMSKFSYDDIQSRLNVFSGWSPVDKRRILQKALWEELTGGNSLSLYRWLDPEAYKTAIESQDELSKLIGKEIPEWQFEVYQKYAKEMAFMSKNSAAMKMAGFLTSPRRYRFWQTILWYMQLPVLLVMNTTGLVPELLMKYKWVVWWDVMSFMRRFGIMAPVKELTERELRWKFGGFFNKVKHLAINSKDAVKHGLYNAWEMMAKDELEAAHFLEAFEYLHPQYDNLDEFAKDLMQMSDEQRAATLDRLNSFAKQKLTTNFELGKKVFSDDAVGNTAYFFDAAFSFMGGRWTSVFRRSKQKVEDMLWMIFGKESRMFWNQYGQRFLEIMATEWYGAARKFSQEIYMKDMDTMSFFAKLFMWMQAGFLYERYTNNWEYNDTMEDRRDQLSVADASLFSMPVQSLSSTPKWRIALAFIDNLITPFTDERYVKEWETKLDASMKSAAFFTTDQILKEVQRRFPHIKAAAKATWWLVAEYDETSFWKEFAKWYTDATQGMMRYASTELEKMWFSTEVPLTPTARTMEVFGTADNYISDIRDLQKVDKFQRSTQSRDSFFRRLWYTAPIIWQFKQWWFIAWENASDQLWKIMATDKNRRPMLQGDIDPSLASWMWRHTYDVIAQFAPASQRKEEWRFDDLRKQYSYVDKKTGERKSIFNLQNKEDVFVKEAMDTIATGKKEDLLELFKNVDPNGKNMVHFVTLLNQSKPGSWREMIAQLMTEEYRDYIKSHKLYKIRDTNKDLDTEIKGMLGQKYMPLLYTADKDSYFKWPMMYYLYDKYPDVRKYLTDPWKNWFWQEISVAYYWTDDKGEKVKKVNQRMQSAIEAHTIANMAVASWDPFGKMMNSAFTAILNPKRRDEDVGQTLSMMNIVLDTIKNSSLSDTEKAYHQASGIIQLIPMLKDMQKDTWIREKLWDVRDKTLWFVFGTARDVRDAEKALWELQYYNDHFKMWYNPKETTKGYWYYNSGWNQYSGRASSSWKQTSWSYKSTYWTFRSMLKNFTNTNPEINDYQSTTKLNYWKKLRDYVAALWRYRDEHLWIRYRASSEAPIKQKQPDVWRSYSAGKWYARPGWKRPSIEKQLSPPRTRTTIMRWLRKTKPAKNKTRKRLTKWWWAGLAS